MSSGSHIPDFGWGDPSGNSVIDWGYGATGPGTTQPPSTVPPTTQAPITTPPGPSIYGSRVGGGVVYKSGLDELVGRFWVELANGFGATAALQAPLCTLEVFREDGTLVGGAPAVGRFDPIDYARARFLIHAPGLASPHNYIARVTLVATTGEIYTRTIGMPVP